MSDDVDQTALQAWIETELKPRAFDAHIRPRIFALSMAAVDYLPDVLERQANQKEFNLPIWEYLEIAASAERIRNGRQMMRRHRALFNEIEQTFGVEPEVVTAIWGLETGYGVVMGTTPTLSALATLAFRGRRARFFEDELISAMRIVQSKGCTPESLHGSWAGALGHGQFLPSSVIGFAVDFDGDGTSDICGTDPTDGLASIANYLLKHEWKKGQPWGLELRLPDGFDYALAGIDQARSSREWAALGVTAADGGPVPDYGAGSILLPAGAGGVALLVLRNFHVITQYNKSEVYSVAVGHLSDRILGGRPFVGAWPTDEIVLSHDDVGELQYLLTGTGYDTMGVDGMRGPNTVRALRKWQIAQGLVPDGHIGRAVLERLRRKDA